MKKYLELKINKRNLWIGGLVLIMMCGAGGYYFWCSFHPVVNIQISNSSIGEKLNVEVPNIVVAGKGIANPAASVELKLNNIVMQHEFLCQYIKDNYVESDIKLTIVIKDNQTILKYFGNALTKDNQTTYFEKEIVLEFVIDANITNLY